MGCSCDWQRTGSRSTRSAPGRSATRSSALFQEQLIYRGKRLVNWDTLLQTAVSDDEVFHETVPGHFWYFHYPVIDPKPGEPKHVTIATTRPETMLGDTAVAVHPDPASGARRRRRPNCASGWPPRPAKQKAEIQAEHRRRVGSAAGRCCRSWSRCATWPWTAAR